MSTYLMAFTCFVAGFNTCLLITTWMRRRPMKVEKFDFTIDTRQCESRGEFVVPLKDVASFPIGRYR